MKKRYLIILLSIFTLQLLCHAEETNNGDPKQQENYIELSQLDPISFLDILKEQKSGSVIVSFAPKGWIKMEHVNQLIKMVDSEEPSAFVWSIAMSYLPSDKTSTVGNEAMFLIEGFKKGSYPPGGSSVLGFKGNPREYKEWYSNLKNKNL